MQEILAEKRRKSDASLQRRYSQPTKAIESALNEKAVQKLQEKAAEETKGMRKHKSNPEIEYSRPGIFH